MLLYTITALSTAPILTSLCTSYLPCLLTTLNNIIGQLDTTFDPNFGQPCSKTTLEVQLIFEEPYYIAGPHTNDD